ncbi:MAG: hypothetical protein ABIV42_00980 [Nitrosospira sp.]
MRFLSRFPLYHQARFPLYRLKASIHAFPGTLAANFGAPFHAVQLLATFATGIANFRTDFAKLPAKS